MSSETYIGLDVHQATISVAVMELKPAHRFCIAVRPHRDVMCTVPHIDPRGMRVNYREAWVLGLQSAAPFLSLLPVSPQHFACRHLCSPHRKIRIRFDPVTIG